MVLPRIDEGMAIPARIDELGSGSGESMESVESRNSQNSESTVASEADKKKQRKKQTHKVLQTRMQTGNAKQYHKTNSTVFLKRDMNRKDSHWKIIVNA